MLELYLLRHADAAHLADTPDHERPLTDKGRRQTVAVAQYFRQNQIALDRVVVSTSLRTQETWQGIAEAFSPTPEKLDDGRIYEASVGDIMQVVRQTPKDIERLLLIGHNPGFEMLVRHLAVEGAASAVKAFYSGFEKAAVAVLRFDSDDWANLAVHSGFLASFWVPEAT